MSVRQVMEYMDELVKNGQLPGKNSDQPEKVVDQEEKKESNEEVKKEKRFFSKFFKQKKSEIKPEMKVLINIPDQEMSLNQEEFVKFSKLIMEIDLKISKAEIIKTNGDDKDGNN